MYRGLKSAIVCGGFATLTACGGGGGGGGINPTPTPPVTVASFPLKSSEPFQTIYSHRAFTGSGNMLSGQSGISGRSPSFTISYDAANGTYSINNEGLTATFGSTDRTISGNYDVYTKQANGISDELRLFGNIREGGPSGGAPLQLSYLSFGTWTRTTETTGETRKFHFLLGYPTQSSSMPTTGSASYNTIVTGSMLEGGAGYPNTENGVNGTATFSANFASGSIATELSLTRQGNNQPLGTYSGTASIDASKQFNGAFTSTAPNFSSGTFGGGFFGPSAAEMGYAFQIYKFNPDPYAGTTVQPQHTYINGIVVGRKK